MPEMIELSVMARAAAGSAEARRMRRSGDLPAVIYGGGGESLVKLSTFEFMKKVGFSSSIMVALVGEGGERSTAIIKEVQWDRLTDKPLHVDFYRVSMDQIVEVKVPLQIEGTPKGLLFGGVLDQLMYEVQVKVKASAIPSRITVDVSGLDIGDGIHESDLEVPEGVTVDTPGDHPVAHVVPPTVEKVKEEEAEATAEEASAASDSEEKK